VIVLYGATGYTGRLVTAELVRRGLEFRLAGRNRDKLERLAASTGAGSEIRVASVGDPGSLGAMLEGAHVLINCAGPFSLAGDPVVAAAIAAGTHYLDSTGEQSFMRSVFERHGPEAERRGVALVTAMGFDYVPGDLLARLTADGHEPLDTLEIAYAVKGFGASRGTTRSAVEMMKGRDIVYRDGAWRSGPLSLEPGRFQFPEPVGTQRTARYPCGEVLTVPRHTQVRELITRITLATLAPAPQLAPVVPLIAPVLGLAARSPLGRLIDSGIERMPEGPSEQERQAARFTIVADARGADGSAVRGVVEGRDVYGLTAVTLVEGAERLAADGFEGRGALAPSQAFDAASFLDALAPHGVTYTLEKPASAPA
jgi:short subunit dehydrogenase-like uncharacterized protein